MVEKLAGVDGVIAGVEEYDAELLESFPRLRCISRCGVGTDSIDLEAARRLNIAVLTTIDEVVEPVAEMTLAMILALARNLSVHIHDFHQGLWKKHTGFLLSEWTIGLVGYGRIARAVHHLLRSFRCRVIASDPYLKREEFPDTELVPLEFLLTQSDVVSLHATRPKEQGAILGYREMAMMKKGCRLINTSRGYLVDESALFQLLKSGDISAAGLDVFADEPYSGALTQLPQVLCTPHVSTMTRASRSGMEMRAVTNLIDHFSHRQT